MGKTRGLIIEFIGTNRGNYPWRPVAFFFFYMQYIIGDYIIIVINLTIREITFFFFFFCGKNTNSEYKNIHLFKLFNYHNIYRIPYRKYLTYSTNRYFFVFYRIPFGD